MSKAAGLAADRSAALGSLEDARAELAASEEAAAGLRLELAGSQAEATRLRCGHHSPSRVVHDMVAISHWGSPMHGASSLTSEPFIISC